MVLVVCLLLALSAGVLSVWTLSLQTPFRLIDDYGAPRGIWDRSARQDLEVNVLLGGNQVRFRPTHDFGQRLAWALFGANHHWHHALRLLMKAAAFAALLATALLHVEGSAGARLACLPRLTIALLAVSLFFYLPNNPEARLAPQELSTAMYFLGHLFFLFRPTQGRARARDDGLALACFALGLWSKEPNVVPGAILLALAVLEVSGRPGNLSRGRLALFVGYAGIWVHAALKVTVMTVQGGYGRPPFEWSGLVTMSRAVPRQVLLGATAWWMPALFIAGLTSFAWRAIGHEANRSLKRRAALLGCLLLAALAQYLLLWSPVLRYAYPLDVVLILLTVIGFGLLLASAPTPAALRRRSLALSAVAAIFALGSYRDMAAQFATQYVAGRTEAATLERVERLIAERPPRTVFVVMESEYDARMSFYFNWHLPVFLGRRAAISVGRKPTDVPVGAYWVTRHDGAAGFERVVEVTPPPAPTVMALSTIVSRVVRFGGAEADPLVDAGAPGLPPASWFILQRR